MDDPIRPHQNYAKHEVAQRKRMSQLDIARINKLYRCPNCGNVLLSTSTIPVTVITVTEPTTSVPSLSAQGKEKITTESSIDKTEDEEAPATSTTRKALPPVKGPSQLTMVVQVVYRWPFKKNWATFLFSTGWTNTGAWIVPDEGH